MHLFVSFPINILLLLRCVHIWSTQSGQLVHSYRGTGGIFEVPELTINRDQFCCNNNESWSQIEPQINPFVAGLLEQPRRQGWCKREWRHRVCSRLEEVRNTLSSKDRYNSRSRQILSVFVLDSRKWGRTYFGGGGGVNGLVAQGQGGGLSFSP